MVVRRHGGRHVAVPRHQRGQRDRDVAHGFTLPDGLALPNLATGRLPSDAGRSGLATYVAEKLDEIAPHAIHVELVNSILWQELTSALLPSYELIALFGGPLYRFCERAALDATTVATYTEAVIP